MIRDIIHVNLNVTDIQRSIAFYEMIGFQILNVFGDHPNADGTESMALEGGRCGGVVMTLGDHDRCWTKIEWIE